MITSSTVVFICVMLNISLGLKMLAAGIMRTAVSGDGSGWYFILTLTLSAIPDVFAGLAVLASLKN